MSTLQKLHVAVKRFGVTYVSKAKYHRFRTGIGQLSLHEFGSLNATGRQTSPNRWTGEIRMRRSVTDTRLADSSEAALIVPILLATL